MNDEIFCDLVKTLCPKIYEMFGYLLLLGQRENKELEWTDFARMNEYEKYGWSEILEKLEKIQMEVKK